MKALETAPPEAKEVNLTLEIAARGITLLYIKERTETLIRRITETVTDDRLDQEKKLCYVCAVSCAVVNDLNKYIDDRLKAYAEALEAAAGTKPEKRRTTGLRPE